ncbi:MAG TPA: M20/M25/M40 family metallo-hydrolase [Vicinamibacterales bacterium]|nr:M20/M25/M40 family metallo-hydrolase [Vicinamibacterales bacterium]
MRYVFASVLALVLVTTPPVSGQPSPLSSRERAIADYVDAHNHEAIALLERAVNINSGTQNFAGVREMGALAAAQLEPLGFTTRWIDGAPFKRAGHLIAEHPGAGSKFLLIGHLDTVFEPDSPFQKFERISDQQARGPGIIDMKGGVVIIVQALKALQAADALKQMNVTVVLTGDEESAGDPQDVARAPLVAAATGAAVAIGFEDGAGDPRTAVIGRRGTTSWTLTVTGKPAHSSQIFRPDIGYGAIFEAARILDAFRQSLAGEPHLTFNPALVLGGTQVQFDAVQSRGTAFGKDNVIPERAVVMGDLRALSVEQFASARQRMTQIVASSSLPQTKAEIAFDEGYPPLAPTEGNQRLLTMYDQASRDIGAGAVAAVDPDRAGAADVSFVAGHVPMIIDGIGLMGDGGHTVNETADLTTLPSQTKRAALLLYRLATAPAGSR